MIQSKLPVGASVMDPDPDPHNPKADPGIKKLPEKKRKK
jgi:hypothetical protein